MNPCKLIALISAVVTAALILVQVWVPHEALTYAGWVNIGRAVATGFIVCITSLVVGLAMRGGCK